MTSISLRVIGMVSASVLAAAVVGANGASQNAPMPSDQAIRDILANRIDVERQHVGVVVGVIETGGCRVVGHGRFGRSDTRPVSGITMFEIGSVTLEPAGNWDLPALVGAGALRSTANDLLQFLSAR